MTSTAGENRIIGELHTVDDRGVVHVEERFDTDIEDLWGALTDPGRVPSWLGGIEGDLQTGGRFDAFFVVSGWEGECTVEECAAPARFVISTRESDGSAGTTIEVNLTSDGDQTVLVVEERGMSLKHLPAYGAGMQVQVENLGAYLRGEEQGDSRARWVELVPAYQDLAEAAS